MNWSEFFAMGGYGLYVWGSYGITVVVLLLNVILPWQQRKSIIKMLTELTRLQQKSSQ